MSGHKRRQNVFLLLIFRSSLASSLSPSGSVSRTHPLSLWRSFCVRRSILFISCTHSLARHSASAPTATVLSEAASAGPDGVFCLRVCHLPTGYCSSFSLTAAEERERRREGDRLRVNRSEEQPSRTREEWEGEREGKRVRKETVGRESTAVSGQMMMKDLRQRLCTPLLTLVPLASPPPLISASLLPPAILLFPRSS